MEETKIGFSPEKEDGNIEYKLKLVEKTEERIERLASQMRFRTEEGDGECIYNLGVEDKGKITGITEAEYEETIKILKSAASMNNYTITLLSSTAIARKKKEKGCTEPLYGKKSRCILKIVPQDEKGQSIQIDKKCIKHREKN